MSWGCRSRNAEAGIQAYRWQINMIRIPPLDLKPVGLVYTEAQVVQLDLAQ